MFCPFPFEESLLRSTSNYNFVTQNSLHNKTLYEKSTEFFQCFCKFFIYYNYTVEDVDPVVVELCEEYLNTSIEAVNGTEKPWQPLPEVPRISDASVIILTVLYSIVFSLAVVGNMIVMLVVIFNKHFRGSATSLIFSLAVADLLITIFCMPFNLLLIRSRNGYNWDFGDAWCKIVPFMQIFAVVGNIFTLIAMAIERYLVIIHPLKTKSLQRPQVTIIILVCVWSLSAVYAIPCVVWYDISPPLNYFKICQLDDEETDSMIIYRTVTYIMLFIVPLLLCSIAYIRIGHQLWVRNTIGIQASTYDQLRLRTTRRVITMLIVVQVLFAVNWSPTMTFELIVAWNHEDYKVTGKNLTIRYYLQWLAMCNSCLNPIVYTFMHEKFRKSIMCLEKKKKKKSQVVPVSAAVVAPVNSLSTSSNLRKNNDCTQSTHLTDVKSTSTPGVLVKQTNNQFLTVKNTV